MQATNDSANVTSQRFPLGVAVAGMLLGVAAAVAGIQLGVAAATAGLNIFGPASATAPAPLTRVGADGGQAVDSFQRWSGSQVISAFKEAGLELTIPPAENRAADDGLATWLPVDSTRFLIPSAGEGEGGMLLSLASAEDLKRMQNYYLGLNRSLPAFGSWVFVKDNLLLQINRSLPEARAKQYEAALNSIK